MATEIERRFLVMGEDWRALAAAPRYIRQAYLSAAPNASVRIRIVDGEEAFLTVKSGTPGVKRAEFEYPIPIRDAEELMRLRTGSVLDKKRYSVPLEGALWEIDVFEGALEGLVIAEIELSRQGDDVFLPDWLGREITHDARFSNASLAMSGMAGKL